MPALKDAGYILLELDKPAEDKKSFPFASVLKQEQEDSLQVIFDSLAD